MAQLKILWSLVKIVMIVITNGLAVSVFVRWSKIRGYGQDRRNKGFMRHRSGRLTGLPEASSCGSISSLCRLPPPSPPASGYIIDCKWFSYLVPVASSLILMRFLSRFGSYVIDSIVDSSMFAGFCSFAIRASSSSWPSPPLFCYVIDSV